MLLLVFSSLLFPLLMQMANAQGPPSIAIDPRQRTGDDAGQIPRPDIRADAELVLVPVSVNDPFGRPVSGLSEQYFKITDNGEPQTISAFFRDEEPVAMGLVLDTSGSMGTNMNFARTAARYFTANANEGDEFALVEFDTRAHLSVPLTNDLAHIQYELLFNDSSGRTALLDAVFLAITELQKSELRRKALVVVSDGGENSSRYSRSEMLNVIRESNVLIYSVFIGVRYAGDTQSNPGLLDDISEATGGRSFDIGRGLGSLQELAQKIAIDLRNRYVLGYVPTDRSRDGRYHDIKLELNPPRGLPKLSTYWRRGYYAPTN